MNELSEIETDLLGDIKAFIQRFVVLPSDEHATVLAVWVLHTWLFQAASVTPYLFVYSAQPASGKTRLMEVLSVITRNARRADDMTAPVMFKIIERECPTLMIDEVDTIWSGSRNEPKRGLLNSGYERGGCAWREVARELREFSTFCPKVLAGLNNGFFPETIKSRAIPIAMKQKMGRTERFLKSEVERRADTEALLDSIGAFTEEAFVDVTAARPAPMDQLSDRQDEISQPLLAIAAVLGCEAELRRSLEAIFAQKRPVSPVQSILLRIREAFGGADKMFTDDLCAALGKAYNGRQLALWLEPFGIAPKTVRIGSRQLKGYERSQFEDVWATTLEPEQEMVEPESEIDLTDLATTTTLTA